LKKEKGKRKNEKENEKGKRKKEKGKKEIFISSYINRSYKYGKHQK
jgi:hypothetical protein